MSEAFSFELVSPEALVLGGEASEVVVPGSEGYFTVLAKHSPFMTTVKPGIVDVKMSDGEAKRIFVRGGFADVSPDGFTLLAEQATMLEDFNMEELDQDIQAARDDVKDSDGEKKAKAEAVLAQLEDSKAAVEAARN
ncbi:ATP synthase epsilon chain [Nymphon striatum]|jgi:F-type H+-transporting ATPase subunit epsilon|nr:ATP synthase epsilon chain [Nymphon striatum]